VSMNRLADTHEALNDLLAMWVRDHGWDYNICHMALRMLARNHAIDPQLPLTVGFKEKCDEWCIIHRLDGKLAPAPPSPKLEGPNQQG
jgi:hypothetical protein